MSTSTLSSSIQTNYLTQFFTLDKGPVMMNSYVETEDNHPSSDIDVIRKQEAQEKYIAQEFKSIDVMSQDDPLIPYCTAKDAFTPFMYYEYSAGQLVDCFTTKHDTHEYVRINGRIISMKEDRCGLSGIKWIVEFDPQVASQILNIDVTSHVFSSQNMKPGFLNYKPYLYGVNHLTSIVSLDDVYPLKEYMDTKVNPYSKYPYEMNQRVYCAIVGDLKGTYVVFQGSILGQYSISWWLVKPYNLNALSLQQSRKETLLINRAHMYPGELECKICRKVSVSSLGIQWNGKCTSCYMKKQ